MCHIIGDTFIPAKNSILFCCDRVWQSLIYLNWFDNFSDSSFLWSKLENESAKGMTKQAVNKMDINQKFKKKILLLETSPVKLNKTKINISFGSSNLCVMQNWHSCYGISWPLGATGNTGNICQLYWVLRNWRKVDLLLFVLK